MNKQMAQNNQNGANMVQTNHLYRFHSGGAPDWPPCDLHRTWGETGGVFSPISDSANDNFVSQKG